jgi:hypothetical protein
MTDFPRVCLDRILPSRSVRQQVIRVGQKLRAVNFPRALWVNGSTLRVAFLDGTPEEHAITKRQALWWTQWANIKFAFTDDQDAEIRVTFDPGNGAWSFIGNDARLISVTEPTMNLGFLGGGTAAHEFGHALSLGHEHQNPEGGIRWNREAVIRDLSGPPNNWSVQEIEYNVLQRYSVDQVRGTNFDPLSIMLYYFPSSWVVDGVGTKANETISQMDASYIGSSAAYPGIPTTPMVTLPVVDVSGTPAEIGSPSEEDIFSFTVIQSGKHIMETRGATDLVMQLFGPNSSTALIAYDDDSGNGRNSRIEQDLETGSYILQVRHYNTARGQGKYSVLVTRTQDT